MNKELTPEQIKIQKPYLDWSLTEKEYDYICKKLLFRLPNYTETSLFSVMWSEHCSYKKSKPVLKLFPTKGEYVLQGPGEGAGVVDIGDDQAVVFKAESHNHPTAVEPFQGAATGVGGILRDVFSMGARPIATLDSLHFGNLKNKHTQFLLSQTVAGISNYGNCMGIPTVGGEISFDDCYENNPVMNAMSVGLVNQKDLQKGIASDTGNKIMYIGAKTGRDGIHGATFASHEFDEEHEKQHSAVQVGDPFMEKLLMEACLDLIHNHSDDLIGIQDMGAAGLVSSSSEMANEGHVGIHLNLDLVPKRETEMTPAEIMLSESQERMLLCVKKDSATSIKNLFQKYALEAQVIGEVTNNHDYVLTYQGKVVCDIPVSSLTKDVLVQTSTEQRPKYLDKLNTEWRPEIKDLTGTVIKLIKQPTIASKKHFTETYDSMVRSSTLQGPGHDSSIVRIPDTQKAIAMTTDTQSRFVYLNPKIGGQISVIEAATNIIASGALPLAITDCLNYGDPNDPEVFYQLHQSVIGIAEACEKLNTPVVSGNVSLYNETDNHAIYPSPMIGMVGLIKDVHKTIDIKAKKVGDLLYLIGTTEDDFAGSQIQKMLTGKIFGRLSEVDLTKINEYLQLTLKQMHQGLINSCHDLSEGGLVVSLAEALFNTNLGARIKNLSKNQLFSETPGRLLVSVSLENKLEFETNMGKYANYIGKIIPKYEIQFDLVDDQSTIALDELNKSYQEAIPCLMNQKD